MKRLLTCFAGLLALTTSSCALASLLTVTPKTLIDQTVNCPTDENLKAEGFKVLSTQTWSQGVIVLYTALCPTDDSKTAMRPVFGHKVVKRNGTIWQVSGSGSYRTANESAPSEELVEYGIGRSSNQRSGSAPSQKAPSQKEEPYIILYGRVLKPSVVAVEATFDNGKIVRDESSNGVFALLAAGASGVCEVRVLGADNQILRQEDLAMPKQRTRSEPIIRCLPMSHQL
ncbi:MAG: hypothetical protein KME42_00315 [Tildeniella nuda ZEHNDER 1965/U140]|jgi:hypothetical protein|nr:hypothetical protein [Tildeniella nuda ZEHNDER 1965/U140]